MTLFCSVKPALAWRERRVVVALSRAEANSRPSRPWPAEAQNVYNIARASAARHSLSHMRPAADVIAAGDNCCQAPSSTSGSKRSPRRALSVLQARAFDCHGARGGPPGASAQSALASRSQQKGLASSSAALLRRASRPGHWPGGLCRHNLGQARDGLAQALLRPLKRLLGAHERLFKLLFAASAMAWLTARLRRGYESVRPGATGAARATNLAEAQRPARSRPIA